MAPSVPPIPAAVRRRALAHGEVGARWLRELPSVVPELERRWDLTVDDTLAGGTAAYVAGDLYVVNGQFNDGPEEPTEVVRADGS